ncbi:hypothetical protein LMIY3S_03653 [Labrys miyagiensis]
MKCDRPNGYLPTPDFTCISPGCKFVAGVRPFRAGSFRLDHEVLGDKFVVHNYGHGGAGISMSWGCADAVATIVRSYASPSEGKSIAVLGAGVMGLTAATLLATDYPVTIYADRLLGTTSDVAGGQWAPSVVDFDENNPTAKLQFENILRVAFRMHEQRLGTTFGVSRRINYTKKRSKTFEKVPRDIIPDPHRFTPLPFQKMNSNGYGYCTLLVEPPIFLNKLRRDLSERGIVPKQQLFKSTADLAKLPEQIIVNCTGLGSRELFRDPHFIPKKGQLVLLPAQHQLQWLYSTDQTYVFPRDDHVVVGGTYECNVDDENPDPTICEHVRKNAEDVFAGKRLNSKLKDASWLMRNK